MAPLLGFLRGLGVAPQPRMPVPQTPADQLAMRFGEYLARERGLAGESVRSYTGVARRFLAGVALGDDAGAEGLTAGDVTGFVRRECAGRGVASAKATVTGLRSLLRFLHADGHAAAALAGAVPAAARRRAVRLPGGPRARGYPAAAGCMRPRYRARARDYAIILAMARLGLRAGEVACLRIADVNWRDGLLAVRGKGSRRDVLPLPADVGHAMAGYRTSARPGRPRPARTCSRAHARRRPAAPRLGRRDHVQSLPAGRGSPRSGRTGCGTPWPAGLLAHGAALEEMARLLRHDDLTTTAVYARCDLARLAALARPCPAGGNRMTSMREHPAAYLAMRRALGHRLAKARDGCCWTSRPGWSQAEPACLTTRDALEWAVSSPGAGPVTRRLAADGRPLLRPASGGPRPGMPGPAAGPADRPRPGGSRPRTCTHRRRSPRSSTAAGTLRSPRTGSDHERLISLLAVTGMRIKEALTPDPRRCRPQRRRLADHPAPSSARSAWCRCTPPCDGARRVRQPCAISSARSRRPARSSSPPPAGRCAPTSPAATFWQILDRAGIQAPPRPRPRLHDLRHSFAVTTYLDWYRAGADVNALAPALSTYLGHRCPSDTYWYLTAAPELLALADAERLTPFKETQP